MKRKYGLLRALLWQRGITQTDLSNMLDIAPSTLSRKFTGKTVWTLPEAAKMLKILRLPYSKLPVIFPENGVDKDDGGQAWAELTGI